jgi:hypothetical protein
VVEALEIPLVVTRARRPAVRVKRSRFMALSLRDANPLGKPFENR